MCYGGYDAAYFAQIARREARYKMVREAVEQAAALRAKQAAATRAINRNARTAVTKIAGLLDELPEQRVADPRREALPA